MHDSERIDDRAREIRGRNSSHGIWWESEAADARVRAEREIREEERRRRTESS